MWYSFNRVPDSLCDYKVSKTASILVPCVFRAGVGSVRGLWMRVELKEGLVLTCEHYLGQGERRSVILPGYLLSVVETASKQTHKGWHFSRNEEVYALFQLYSNEHLWSVSNKK